MQGTWVQAPRQEGPLEQETMEVATHSSTAAWEIPPTEEPGGAQSRASQESDTTEGPNSRLPRLQTRSCSAHEVSVP